MNRQIGIVGLACAVAANTALCAGTEARPISGRHAREWLRWVIPLPKEAQIRQQVTVAASDVRLTLHGEAGPLEQNAPSSWSARSSPSSGPAGASLPPTTR